MRSTLPSNRTVIFPSSMPMDGSKIAVRNPEVFVGRRELDAVACCKLPFSLAKDIYTSEPSRVIGDARSVLQLDGESVGAGINGADGSEATALDAFGLAAGGVLQYLASVVSRGPGAVCAGHIGAVGETCGTLAVVGQRARCRNSTRTASLICWRLRLSGETMIVFSGRAA